MMYLVIAQVNCFIQTNGAIPPSHGESAQIIKLTADKKVIALVKNKVTRTEQ